MGNVNGCFVPDNLIEMGIDLKLGKGIQGGGGFIQNDERRIFVKRPGKGDFCASPPEISTPSSSKSL